MPLITPSCLLAYGLVLAFEMPPEMAVGMILLGSCPSGTASNVMGFLARPTFPCRFDYNLLDTLGADRDALYRLGLGRQWVEVSFTAMAMTVMKVILVPGFGPLSTSTHGRKTRRLSVEDLGPRFRLWRFSYPRRCHCRQRG